MTMTTRQIIETDESSRPFPRDKDARMRRARLMVKLMREELTPSEHSFEDHEALAKLRGRVI